MLRNRPQSMQLVYSTVKSVPDSSTGQTRYCIYTKHIRSCWLLALISEQCVIGFGLLNDINFPNLMAFSM